MNEFKMFRNASGIYPTMAKGASLMRNLERSIRVLPRYKNVDMELWGLVTDTHKFIVNGWDNTNSKQIMLRVEFDEYHESYIVVHDFLCKV